ncbi:hydrolase [Sphingorhabdus sp. EL138]|jgi:glutamate carboxypeptidase|uniref:hydrolase n=1 Tax=Sphingorhabdus sp. EL138 TaxID=2073156 RepID=UPI0025F69068|nr:hydrolase [Sphingorhabdus sp. EL138]
MHTLTDNERQVLETIQQQSMLDEVQSWSAVNSGSGNLDGLATTAKMLADAFSVLPGEVALVNPEPVDRVLADGSIKAAAHGQHLLVTVRPDAPTQLLFTGHMDTVFPADHEFQKLRWLDDGVLNGPGVADMKGGVSVLLAALRAVELSASISRTGYQILINSDEEVGSPSSAKLIAELARNKLAALTYEPALPDGTLAGARGGSGNFSVIFSGLSAHAGRNPDVGRNAVLAAADLALRLKRLSREGLSVNPAKIDGGGPNNVVPDHAILRVNFRPRTPEIVTQTEADLRRIIADIEREHDVRAHLHGSFGRPPKPIDDRAAKLFALVKQTGADLGLSIAWRSSGGVCDGNNIAACGVPVVDTMGVRGGNIHSNDEFLIVESLTERAQLSALTIMRLSEKGAL